MKPAEEELVPWEPEESWWTAYEGTLTDFSSRAQDVLRADCLYVAARGVLGAGALGSPSWPVSRVRRGLVMGAVQSGKTASLLGVTALAFDARVDLVVVLGGTRIALWRQTLDRFKRALEPVHGSARRWQLRPAAQTGDESADLAGAYEFGVQAAARALSRGRPLAVVAMKQGDHLRAVRRSIANVVEAAERLGKDIHMVVLDDEADDGSILDARAEAGLDPSLAHLKQVPRQIVDLWDSRPHGGTTMSQRLHVTYVGYTATPQANLLQSSQNPLAPKDFVAALRTPLDHGELEPRETTYAEPSGPRNYYSGGELYYHRLSEANLCRALPEAPGESDLASAIRCYLIAGAIRRLLAAKEAPNQEPFNISSSTVRAAMALSSPHTMLVHPSASTEVHLEVAAKILAWFGGLTFDQACSQLDDGDWTLPLAGVLKDLSSREEAWAQWLEDFQESSTKVADQLAWSAAPQLETWTVVKECLTDVVLPQVRLAVVNSDPRGGDRPDFEPTEDELGWHPPRDVCTIFVSGNVMSRGLTLEGLTTTLFRRTTKDPYADTQMQMQRWFGYRGQMLPFCRVFLPKEQLELFRSYHDTDEALRCDVLAAMSDDDPVVPQVLQGRDFLATAKIANLTNQPLFPGLDPVVQIVGPLDAVDGNLRLVADLFEEPSSAVAPAPGGVRGRLLQRTLSLLETAALLDSMRYPAYEPGPTGWLGSYWAAIARQVGVRATDDEHHPLYRPPGEGGDEPLERGASPYLLAAYLRLWDACLTRRARGMFPTDQPDTQWSLLDLHQKAATAPQFRVGLRFGSGQPVAEAGFEDLGFEVPAMTRKIVKGYLDAPWGSRGRNQEGVIRGDQSFDLPAGAERGRRRMPGDDGLVLFQVLEQPEGHPTVGIGLVVPLGGPDHFAAKITEL